MNYILVLYYGSFSSRNSDNQDELEQNSNYGDMNGHYIVSVFRLDMNNYIFYKLFIFIQENINLLPDMIRFCCGVVLRFYQQYRGLGQCNRTTST